MWFMCYVSHNRWPNSTYRMSTLLTCPWKIVSPHFGRYLGQLTGRYLGQLLVLWEIVRSTRVCECSKQRIFWLLSDFNKKRLWWSNESASKHSCRFSFIATTSETDSDRLLCGQSSTRGIYGNASKWPLTSAWRGCQVSSRWF